MHATAVLDTGRFYAGENRVKRLLVDTEAKVLDGKRAIVVDEVESQSIIHMNRRKRSGTGFRPADTKQLRQAFGRSSLVFRGYDDVIQFDSHLRWSFRLFGSRYVREPSMYNCS